MSHEQFSALQSECPVCLTECNLKYNVSSKCRHQFCENCSINYIKASADNFSAARCLQEGCQETLDQKLPIYSKVDQQTKQKLRKFQRFLFYKNNPQYKNCSKESCNSYFLKNGNDQKCKKCKLNHCKKCYQVSHNGPCKENVEEAQMNANGFRKCPSCESWVQKNQGCQFIDCKCGAKFCYNCGVYFDRCPCRKKQQWTENNQIRKSLSEIQFSTFKLKSPLRIVLSLILVPLKLIFSIVFLLLLVCTTLAMISAAIPCIVLFGCPCGIMHEVRQTDKKNGEGIACCMMLFYPLLVIFCLGLTLVMLLMYPWWRNQYHHGVYDGLENHILGFTGCYLNLMKALW